MRFCESLAARATSRLRSELVTDTELELMPLEVHEIERAWDSGSPTPGLKIPGGREPSSLTEPRVKRRAQIDRLPGKCVQCGTVVTAQIARFSSDPHARRHLRRDGGSDAERRLLLDPARRQQARSIGIEQEV